MTESPQTEQQAIESPSEAAVEQVAEVQILSVLQRSEITRKKTLEAIIRDGLKTFTDVGNALLEIRDRRLYRDTHISFESYCKTKWGITKTHANRLIGASRVVDNIKEVGPIPLNESTVRPLTSLQPDQQREVWRKLTARVDDPKSVTSHIVTRIVNEVVGDERRTAKRAKLKKPSMNVRRLDVLAAIDHWAAALLGRKTPQFTSRDHQSLRLSIERL
jgi:hypothetical protein